MLKKEFFFNKINYFVILFFTTIFLALWPLIKDYGVTLDDFIYYVNGEKTYLYVKSLFLSFFDNNIDHSQFRAALKEYPTIYELFLVLICKILGVNDFHNIYLVSHKINFLLFFLALLIFFNIIQIRFNNKFLSLLGILFFILSPRILAESFYNSRDIFFMCLFVFYLNSVINYLNKKNLKNVLLLSFFSALLINTKIFGIIPLTIFSFLYIYNFLNTKSKFILEKKNIFLFFIFCALFIYAFWPYLWSSPFKNLFFALFNMLEKHESLILINLYFGKYIPSDMMPWHYRLVWFFITTPLVVCFLFFLGLVISMKRLFRSFSKSLQKKSDISNNEFFDIFLLSNFLIIFFVVIEFNVSNFGGWRHLYFLYPIVIYLSLYFINEILESSSKIVKYILIIVIFLNLFYNLNWSIKNHPHQYVFFNIVSKKFSKNNFDLDWWGVSHKSSLEYILKDTNKKKIKIFAEGFTSLKDTYLFLNKEDKKRIILSDFKNADYIIDSKMRRIRVNNMIQNNDNFKLVYQLIVDEHVVNGIYKKITETNR